MNPVQEIVSPEEPISPEKTVSPEEIRGLVQQAKERPNSLCTLQDLVKEFHVSQTHLKMSLQRDGFLQDMDGKTAVLFQDALPYIERTVSDPRWERRLRGVVLKRGTPLRVRTREEALREAVKILPDPETLYPIFATLKELELSVGFIGRGKPVVFPRNSKGTFCLPGKELLPIVLKVIRSPRVKWNGEVPVENRTDEEVPSEAGTSEETPIEDGIAEEAPVEDEITKRAPGQVSRRTFTREELLSLLPKGSTAVLVENDPKYGVKPVVIEEVQPDDLIVLDDRGMPVFDKGSSGLDAPPVEQFGTPETVHVPVAQEEHADRYDILVWYLSHPIESQRPSRELADETGYHGRTVNQIRERLGCSRKSDGTYKVYTGARTDPSPLPTVQSEQTSPVGARRQLSLSLCQGERIETDGKNYKVLPKTEGHSVLTSDPPKGDANNIDGLLDTITEVLGDADNISDLLNRIAEVLKECAEALQKIQQTRNGKESTS